MPVHIKKRINKMNLLELHKFLMDKANELNVPYDEISLSIDLHWNTKEPIIIISRIESNSYDGYDVSEIEELIISKKD